MMRLVKRHLFAVGAWHALVRHPVADGLPEGLANLRRRPTSQWASESCSSAMTLLMQGKAMHARQCIRLTADRGLSDRPRPSGLTIVSDMAPARCALRELIWVRCSGAAGGAEAGAALAAPVGGQRTLLLVARLGGLRLHAHPPAALLLLAVCTICVIGLMSGVAVMCVVLPQVRQ